MTRNQTQFEESWKSFSQALKAELGDKASFTSLTISYANTILRDKSRMWFDDYGKCSKWLRTYTEEHPHSGGKIAEIINNEMSFTEEVRVKGIDKNTVIAGTAIGGALGVGISRIASMSLVPTLLSAAVPATAAYIMLSGAAKGSQSEGRVNQIKNYVAELDTYKTKIFNLIED